MTDEGTVGELKETGCELNIEWEIANVFSLSAEVDKFHNSPVFDFLDAAWYLRIYLDGQSKNNSEGYIGIFVVRRDSGTPISADYKLFFKVADGTKEEVTQYKGTFKTKHHGWGVPKALLRSRLLERKSELAPSDVLTVLCSLKHDDIQVVGISLFRRLQNLSACMKKILTEKKRTDVVLKTEEREFPAHRIILESRSPVFTAMFSHDMEENRTGVVNIADVPADAFERVLSYMYSGEIDGMSFDNVFDIYAAADKYDFTDLKQLCKVFVEENMCVERVCDVIKFAELYKEEEMERRARKYFRENMNKILDSDHWKTFVKENSALSVDLLSAAIKEFL